MPENIEKKEPLPEEEGQVVEIEEEKNDEPEQKPEVSTDTEITTEEPISSKVFIRLNIASYRNRISIFASKLPRQ